MTAPSEAILAADEPAAVAEYNVAGGSPMLLVADHAGRRMPRALKNLGLNEAECARHIAWDIGIEGVARALAERLDAHLILQIYSRLVIDCNRPPGTPESMPVESDGTTIPGNQNLSAGAVQARVREIFEPYHNTIARHLDARKNKSPPTILISLHSFTPAFEGVTRLYQAGVMYQRYRALADELRAELSAPGDITVGDNEPYTVDDETDYTIPVHGEKRGIAHVAIEIRQDLIGGQGGQIYWANRLADALPKAVAALR
ncbi:MAG: N-formylglutamate amidohydrolase [Pseudolabrys sp.]